MYQDPAVEAVIENITQIRQDNLDAGGEGSLLVAFEVFKILSQHSDVGIDVFTSTRLTVVDHVANLVYKFEDINPDYDLDVHGSPLLTMPQNHIERGIIKELGKVPYLPELVGFGDLPEDDLCFNVYELCEVCNLHKVPADYRNMVWNQLNETLTARHIETECNAHWGIRPKTQEYVFIDFA